VTPAPRIDGVQPAVVVGPQGHDPKTPYTDQYGRIKVQFHWDRYGKSNEHSSCWLRTPHQSAGNGYGHVWLPRIGCEVLVAFVDGDPDRPTIVAHVYNAQMALPLDLPGEARVGIIKDDGGNYMKIDPTDGGQVMAMFSPTEKTSLKLGKT
jgi:type VI secretion system secreted protein VgrG